MTKQTYTGEAMSFRRRLPKTLGLLVKDLSDQRTRFAAFRFSGWLINALERVPERELIPGPEYFSDEKRNTRRSLALTWARSAHHKLEWYPDMGSEARMCAHLHPTRAEYREINAALRCVPEFLRQEDVETALSRAMDEAEGASEHDIDLPSRSKEMMNRLAASMRERS